MKPGSLNGRLQTDPKLAFGTMTVTNHHYVTCSYDGCEKNNKFITRSGNIKSGTIVAYLSVDGNTVVYCRECISKIVKDLRKELDDTLWAFK